MANNKVRELWQGFRPRAHEIADRLSPDFISMTVYPDGFRRAQFTPLTVHQKWAAVEVSDLTNVPEGMESFTIPAGKYAVFHHRGTAMDAAKTYNYIFNSWQPGSGYELDERPYFELLGEKYVPTSPDSEEDIFIPIKAGA
jgi:AraC family transcriptional regulator